MANRALSRTVIFLDKRLTSVPSYVYYERLLKGGRVKEIFFTKNTTSQEMGGKILDCFPSLAGRDLSRLEFIASYSKGHSMATVATGLQDGCKVVELFGGARKKKVFIYLPSASQTRSSSTLTSTSSTLSSAASSVSTATSTPVTFSLPMSSTATASYHTQTFTLPPSISSISASTSTVPLMSSSTSTSTVPPMPFSGHNSTVPLMSSSTSTTTVPPMPFSAYNSTLPLMSSSTSTFTVPLVLSSTSTVPSLSSSTSISTSPVPRIPTSVSISISSVPPMSSSISIPTFAVPPMSSSTSTFTSSVPCMSSSVSTSSVSPMSSSISTSTFTVPLISSPTFTSTVTPVSSTSTPTLPPVSASGILIDLTTPPSSGASTRRYLTAIASRAGTSFDDTYEDDVIDLDSPGEEDEGAGVDTSCFGDELPLDTSNFGELPVCGYVFDDLSTAGVVTDDASIVSRTSEVLQCINSLERVCGEMAQLPFLTHTFEEFVYQGTQDGRIMMAVLLDDQPLDSQHYRKLITLLNAVDEGDEGCFLWIADHQSPESQKVQLKFSIMPGTVLILSPSLSLAAPQCVEIFDVAVLEEDPFFGATKTAKEICLALKEERERLRARWAQRGYRLNPIEESADVDESGVGDDNENEDSDTEVTFGPGEARSTDDLSATIEDPKEDEAAGKPGETRSTDDLSATIEDPKEDEAAGKPGETRSTDDLSATIEDPKEDEAAGKPEETRSTDDLSATIEDPKEDGAAGKGKKRKNKKKKKKNKKKNKKIKITPVGDSGADPRA